MDENPFATVGYFCGRWYLSVGDVVVAMEGDTSRAAGYGTRTPIWDKAELERAAEAINKNAKIHFTN